MPATRRIHVVRIPNPQLPWNYFDVEILDAVAVQGPNDSETLYYVDATNPTLKPFISDKTPDSKGDIGDLNISSRVSHMVRYTNPDDPTMFFDAETIDAFAAIGPNNAEEAVLIPAAKAVPFVIDNTGNGLGVGVTLQSTRQEHIVKISEIQPLGVVNLSLIHI